MAYLLIRFFVKSESIVQRVKERKQIQAMCTKKAIYATHKSNKLQIYNSTYVLLQFLGKSNATGQFDTKCFVPFHTFIKE